MKMKLLAISLVSASLVIAPATMRADDNDTPKSDKVAEANHKTHEKICQGNHGTVTAKTDNSITIDNKTYALKADTQVNKQEEALLPKTVKVGDTVCFVTSKAADGSMQISKLIAIDKDEKVRVREKENDSPSKEVETPNKNEVK